MWEFKKCHFLLSLANNLKFDGEFIIYWLIQNNFEFIEDKKQRKDKSFTCLITDTGQFFSIEVYFEIKNKGKKVKKVTFYDSLKIIPFGVSKIAKSFNLPISKLEIDYNAYREIGHTLTQQEIDYIKNDVTIVAMALKKFFDEGLTKMTQASNAMYDYKKIITPKYFKEFYPELSIELDGEIRSSYRGGFTYLNPKYQNATVGEGIVLDVNDAGCLINAIKFITDPPNPEGFRKEIQSYKQLRELDKWKLNMFAMAIKNIEKEEEEEDVK